MKNSIFSISDTKGRIQNTSIWDLLLTSRNPFYNLQPTTKYWIMAGLTADCSEYGEEEVKV